MKIVFNNTATKDNSFAIVFTPMIGYSSDISKEEIKERFQKRKIKETKTSMLIVHWLLWGFTIISTKEKTYLK